MSYRSDIDTFKPIHVDDFNRFVKTDGNDERQVVANFTLDEFYNSKIGKPHWISLNIIECAQIIRDWAGVPTEVNSSYRDYVPTGGATYSPHMMGEALDLDFFESNMEEELLVRIRDDFDAKGELFQRLWAAGCRGFGVYDGFVHIDTVPVELYAPFRAKRTMEYRGSKFAYWNKQKRLRNVTIAYGESTEVVVQPSIPDKIGGIVDGLVEEIRNDEDGIESWLAWLMAALFVFSSIALTILIGVKIPEWIAG